MGIKKLSLQSSLGGSLYYDEERLEIVSKELEYFLENNMKLNTLEFAKTVMFSHELKANNDIEGYNDDVNTIKEVIDTMDAIRDSARRQRIINLYYGYRYILSHKNIDKNSLRELYSILSKELLEKSDSSRMGEYYRTAPVYILKRGRLDTEPYEGMESEDLPRFMDSFFEFLHSDSFQDSKTEEYIKSQILHYYFVYIHPYFDVNGRTSRTVAMWQLLNKEAYPYIIFNRGISFSEDDYERSIIMARNSNNLTYFLLYMLRTVHSELEKEVVMQNLSTYANEKLTGLDYQTILYILNMKGNLTIADFAKMYNRKNMKKKTKEIYESMIEPLIDKDILQVERETSKYIYPNEKNKVLSLKHMDELKNNPQFRHIKF